MNSKGTRTTPTGYPIQFTSPLPLEECANRIRQSYGRSMGMSFATIRGHIEKIDDGTYMFSIYQMLKSSRESVSGQFIVQTSSTTLVDAVFKRESSSNTLWIIFIPSLLMMIVACFAASTAWGLVALAILLAFFVYDIYTKRKIRMHPERKPKLREPASELLWWFERTIKDKNYLPL